MFWPHQNRNGVGGSIFKFLYLPVAQLDSASDSDSEGRRFESYRVGQKEAIKISPLLSKQTAWHIIDAQGAA